jgi:hypothetical protein
MLTLLAGWTEELDQMAQIRGGMVIMSLLVMYENISKL